MRKLLISALFAPLALAQLVDFAPTMSGPSAPSPYSVSNSSSFDQAWQAFGGSSHGWIGQTGGTGFVQIDLGAGNATLLQAYSFGGDASLYNTRMPTAWIVEGSNNGITWTTLDSQTGITNWGGTCGGACTSVLGANIKAFMATTRTTAYQFFKFTFSANNGDVSYTQINQIKMYNGTPLAPTQVGGDFAPHNLTSEVSGLPRVVEYSNSYTGGTTPGFLGWRVFDSAAGADSWITNGVAGWVRLDTLYPPGTVLYRYAVTSGYLSPNDQKPPKTWTMEGSNDNVSWTTLDTRSSETGWNTGGETRTYCVTGAATPYRSFRFNVTANNGAASFMQVSELQLYATAGACGATSSVFPILY